MKLSTICLVIGIIAISASSCCTLINCENRIEVTYKLASSGLFPEGQYSLIWQIDGELQEMNEIVPSGGRDSLSFLIDGASSVNLYPLGKEHKEIALELYRDDDVVAPAETYPIDWDTSVCNDCSWPKDDQMQLEAAIEIAVEDFE